MSQIYEKENRGDQLSQVIEMVDVIGQAEEIQMNREALKMK